MSSALWYGYRRIQEVRFLERLEESGNVPLRISSHVAQAYHIIRSFNNWALKNNLPFRLVSRDNDRLTVAERSYLLVCVESIVRRNAA